MFCCSGGFNRIFVRIQIYNQAASPINWIQIRWKWTDIFRIYWNISLNLLLTSMNIKIQWKFDEFVLFQWCTQQYLVSIDVAESFTLLQIEQKKYWRQRHHFHGEIILINYWKIKCRSHVKGILSHLNMFTEHSRTLEEFSIWNLWHNLFRRTVIKEYTLENVENSVACSVVSYD